MTEIEEIERITASNEFWALSSGDHLNMIETLLEKLTEKDEAIKDEWLNAREWEDEYMSLKRRFDELDKGALETYELLKDSSAQVVNLRKALEEIRDYKSYSWNNDRQFIDSRIKDALGEGDKE